MDNIQYNKTIDSSDSGGEGRADNGKRKCHKCHDWKTPEEFYHRGGKPDRICKDCKKSAQKDNYRKKTFTQNVDVIFGNVLNKILEYKIARAQVVLDELRRLGKECETKFQKTLATT